jgi:hypothetical protein
LTSKSDRNIKTLSMAAEHAPRSSTALFEIFPDVVRAVTEAALTATHLDAAAPSRLNTQAWKLQDAGYKSNMLGLGVYEHHAELQVDGTYRVYRHRRTLDRAPGGGLTIVELHPVEFPIATNWNTLRTNTLEFLREMESLISRGQVRIKLENTSGLAEDPDFVKRPRLQPDPIIADDLY